MFSTKREILLDLISLYDTLMPFFPDWLCESAEKWPVWGSSSNPVIHEIHQEGMEAVCMATGEPSSSLHDVIDPERYSSLNK